MMANKLNIRKNMKIIIAGATGFVGKPLVDGWIKQGIDVVVIGRSKDKINEIFHSKVHAVTWDEFNGGKLDPENTECIVNLAGAGIADKRWTTKRKKEILDSRVSATNKIVEYCLQHEVPLLNASAIGIYSQQVISKNGLPPALDEDSPIPVDAKDFLSYVCRPWEYVTEPLKKCGVRTVNLRIGVILGKNGGALKKMAIPFYLLAGGPIGSGYQAVPWISLDDICRSINFLIKNKNIEGPVNLVAPNCVNQRNLAKALGKVLKRPSFIPTPGFILKLALGQMAEELLLNGQHVYPKRLIEQGFKFKHETIDDALIDIYKK